jgi:hypothetical protein
MNLASSIPQVVAPCGLAVGATRVEVYADGQRGGAEFRVVPRAAMVAIPPDTQTFAEADSFLLRLTLRDRYRAIVAGHPSGAVWTHRSPLSGRTARWPGLSQGERSRKASGQVPEPSAASCAPCGQ